MNAQAPVAANDSPLTLAQLCDRACDAVEAFDAHARLHDDEIEAQRGEYERLDAAALTASAEFLSALAMAGLDSARVRRLINRGVMF